MADEARERRLAEALRRNLKKRKDQGRVRATEPDAPADDAADAPEGHAKGPAPRPKP